MKIPLKYRNKPAILVATGPSLTEEVVETIRPYKNDFIIFGCNDSYRLVDYLDLHYACDKAWWDLHAKPFREKYPDLEAYTQAEEYRDSEFNLNIVEGKHARSLSTDSSIIHWGSNSGYQLLNIAFLMGCSRFLLVGYNMQKIGGVRHFFGEHPDGLSKNSPYHKFLSAFDSIEEPIRNIVVNCTPDSALTTFRKGNLKEELENESSYLQ